MPEDQPQAERAHPSLEPLVQAGMSAAGAAATTAFAAWAVGASPTAKIVFAFLVCASVLGTLLILRARRNRAAIAFGITSTTLTAVVAVALSGAAQRDPRAAPSDAIQTRLILHSGDA